MGRLIAYCTSTMVLQQLQHGWDEVWTTSPCGHQECRYQLSSLSQSMYLEGKSISHVSSHAQGSSWVGWFSYCSRGFSGRVSLVGLVVIAFSWSIELFCFWYFKWSARGHVSECFIQIVWRSLVAWVSWSSGCVAEEVQDVLLRKFRMCCLGSSGCVA